MKLLVIGSGECANIGTDRFLVKQGLLTGEPTLMIPASGEKLVSAF